MVLDARAPASEWGDEVYAVPLDGGPSRRLLPRAQSGGVIQGMCCTPDGTGLLFGYHATLVENRQFAGRIERIERLDLASGERSTLIEGALFPTVTRDGSRIAYMTQDEIGGVSLAVAAPDGRDARVVAELSPRFLVVMTPRISPDGGTIVFSAVPQAGVARAADLGPASRARRASRHGLPMDLFQASVASGAVTRLTTFGEDEPYPAWSPDGSVITILATGGLYELKMDGSEPRILGPGEFGGSVDAR
jgi:Tol biopolymer transport system component